MKTALPITAAALLLTACSGSGAGGSNAQEAAIANSITLDGNGKPRPLSPPTRQRDHATLTFPPALLGRWGITEADCDPSNNANKGLIVIRADAVRFYESEARLAGLDRRSEYAITADLAFQGEGRKWTARQSFALASGGTALLRSEQTPAKTYRYGRC